MVSATNSELAVIDTNIVKILNYDVGSDLYDFYRDRLEGKSLVISFVTDLEVRRGLSKESLSRDRHDRVLADLLKYPVIWFNRTFQEAAVELSVLCRRQPPSFQDLMIASTAYALGCPLATDDRRLATQLSVAGFGDVITRHGVDDSAA